MWRKKVIPWVNDSKLYKREYKIRNIWCLVSSTNIMWDFLYLGCCIFFFLEYLHGIIDVFIPFSQPKHLVYFIFEESLMFVICNPEFSFTQCWNGISHIIHSKKFLQLVFPMWLINYFTKDFQYKKINLPEWASWSRTAVTIIIKL